MPRSYSEKRSQETARTVRNVYVGIPPLPTVGECRVKRASRGYHALFNAGAPLHFVESYGATEAEAEANARARADGLLRL